MQLVHEFVVPRPVEVAWRVLTDIEQVAPCMPGAQLQEVQGDTYRGTVKVKVGPIVANFGGEARFRSLDEDAHRVVLEARGKEAGGKGLASALITGQLTPEGDQTRVNVVTDLTLSGRIAQFGRGAIAEVSSKLLGQFVQCLETTVLAGAGADAETPPTEASPTDVPATEAPGTDAPAAPAAEAAATEAPAPGIPTPEAATAEPVIRRIDGPEAEPVNLLSSAGPTILKRLIPALVVVVLLVFLIIYLAS